MFEKTENFCLFSKYMSLERKNISNLNILFYVETFDFVADIIKQNEGTDIFVNF